MIKSITAVNFRGQSLKLELARPDDTGIAITNIAGLGPAKADINYTDLANNDGSIYNSARLQRRNIVISLKFLANSNVELARRKTYQYFPIKKELELIIETDQRIVKTKGFVEANEALIFNRNSGSTISIICPDPYFYATTNSRTVFSGIIPSFEFPFENDGEFTKEIEFGAIDYNTVETVLYEGDASTGITIKIVATGDVTNPIIYNTDTGESIAIDTDKLTTLLGSAIIEGDEITISTVVGEKSITLLRSGIEYNILNCRTPESTWIQISPGDNVFTYVADTGLLNIQFVIENRILYEGV